MVENRATSVGRLPFQLTISEDELSINIIGVGRWREGDPGLTRVPRDGQIIETGQKLSLREVVALRESATVSGCSALILCKAKRILIRVLTFALIPETSAKCETKYDRVSGGYLCDNARGQPQSQGQCRLVYDNGRWVTVRVGGENGDRRRRRRTSSWRRYDRENRLKVSAELGLGF